MGPPFCFQPFSAQSPFFGCFSKRKQGTRVDGRSAGAMNAIVFVCVLYYARKRFLFRHQFGGTKRRSLLRWTSNRRC